MTGLALAESSDQRTNQGRYAAFDAFVATASFVAAAAASIGLSQRPGSASVIWLPAGVAFVAALFGNRWSMTGVAAGSLAINVWAVYDRVGTMPLAGLAVAVLISSAAVAQAWIGAALVRRYAGFPAPMTRARDLLNFLVLAGPVACLPSSLVDVGGLSMGGAMAWSQFGTNWPRWWLGDSLGTAVVAVVALALWGAPKQHWRQRFVMAALPVAGVALAFTAMYWSLMRNAQNKRLERLQTLLTTTQDDFRAWFDNAKVGLDEWREAAPSLSPAAAVVRARTLMAYHDTIWGAGFRPGVAPIGQPVKDICWITRDAMAGNANALDPPSDALQRAAATALRTGKYVAFPANAGPPSLGIENDLAVAFTLPWPKGAAPRTPDDNAARIGLCVIDMRVVLRKATRYLPPSVSRTWQLSAPLELQTDVVTAEEVRLRWTATGCLAYLPTSFAGQTGWIGLAIAEPYFAADETKYLEWLYLLSLVLATLLGSHLLLMAGQTSELHQRIEERRLTNLALSESEEKYRRLVETSHDLIWSVDSAGRWTFVNRKAANEIYGLEPKDMLGRPFTDFQNRGQADIDLKVFADLAAGQAVSDYQTEHCRVDGTAVHMSFNAIPLFDDRGAFLGTTGTAQDISHRRRAEIAASASIERRQRQSQALMALWKSGLLQPGNLDEDLQRIAQSAAETLGIGRVSVWLFDGARSSLVCRHSTDQNRGRFVATDRLAIHDFPAYFRSLENNRCIAAANARTDPRTREFLDAYLEPLAIVSMLDAPIRLEEGVQGVLCNECIEGQPREWSVEDEDFACALADMIALTLEADRRYRAELERKQLEERLWEAQKLESLGVLAGGVAHDFNNLLTGILGYTELAIADAAPDGATFLYLKEIEHASQRAADLCKQMLAYAGKGAFSVGPFDLGQLIGETIKLVQFSISKKARLNLELAADLPPVLGDANQIRQVVMNLVMNASDALGDHAGSIWVATSLQTVQQGELDAMLLGRELAAGSYIGLEVSDDGCGMEPATLTRIFEPFFSTKFTGRGLGLAAVLGIIRSHHGALGVHSEVGAGTRFRILLPPAGAAKVPSQPEPSAHSLGSEVGGIVLVVDDELSVRRLAVHILQTAGFQTAEAQDGEQAIEQFARHRHSVRAVLLDLTMPVMDGRQTMRALRQFAPTLPVVVMSGYAESETGSCADNVGATAFLQKPFTREQVVKKLAEVLNDRRTLAG